MPNNAQRNRARRVLKNVVVAASGRQRPAVAARHCTPQSFGLPFNLEPIPQPARGNVEALCLAETPRGLKPATQFWDGFSGHRRVINPMHSAWTAAACRPALSMR